MHGRVAVPATVAAASEIGSRSMPAGRLGTTVQLPAAKADPGPEIERLRTRNSQTFAANGGSYETHVSRESLNYRDAHGQWQPIDNTLRAEAGVFRNGANRYRLDVPRTLGAGVIRVTHGTAWLEFAPRGAMATAALARGAQATFTSAWAGVELRYEAAPDGVKEALVVRDRASIRDFAFDLRVPIGYTLEQRRSGTVLVRDAGGQVRMRLSRSTMIDAEGAIRNTRSELTRTAAGWQLTIVPDRAWLDDPGRAWPVVIDPTVSFGAGVDCVQASCDIACDIGFEGNGPPPTVAYGSCDGTELYSLNVGETESPSYEGPHFIRQAIVRFDLNDLLPPGAVIEYATIDPGSTGYPVMADLEDLTLYQVNKSWNEDVTGDSRDGTNPWYIPGEQGDGPFSGPILPNQITDMVRRWSSSENPNHGVLFTMPGANQYSETTMLNPVLVVQYAEGDDPDGPVVESMVRSYQYDEPITATEARRRVSLQGRLSNIYNDLEAAIDEADNGGFWIDDSDAGRIKINIKSDQPTPQASKTQGARAVLADHALEDDVDFRSVSHSYDELVAAQDALVAALDGVVAESGYRAYPEIEVNRVRVQKSDALSTAQSAAVDDAADDLTVAVHVEVVPANTLFVEPTSCGGRDFGGGTQGNPNYRVTCDMPYRGGVVLFHENMTPGCTTAFGVHDENDADEYYVSTAGHCLETADANDVYRLRPFTAAQEEDDDWIRIGQPRRRWTTVKGYDLGLISVVNWDSKPEVSDDPSFGGEIVVTTNPFTTPPPAKWDPDYPIRRVAYSAARQRVCAASSNRNAGGYYTVCGRLVSKGITSAPAANGRVRVGLGLVRTCDENAPNTTAKLAQTVVGGFSGAPVFNQRTALGIVSGRAFDLYPNNPASPGCGFAYNGAKDLEREKDVKIITKAP